MRCFKTTNCVLSSSLSRSLPPKCTTRNFGLCCWTAAKNDSKCRGFVTVPPLSQKNRTGGSPSILNSSAEVPLFPKYDENLFTCELPINNVVIVMVMWPVNVNKHCTTITNVKQSVCLSPYKSYKTYKYVSLTAIKIHCLYTSSEMNCLGLVHDQSTDQRIHWPKWNITFVKMHIPVDVRVHEYSHSGTK